MSAKCTASILGESGGYHQTLGVPLGHGLRAHRDHETRGLFALYRRAFDLDHIARTEVFDGDNRAKRLTRIGHGGKAQQISVVIFTLGQRREGRAGNGERGAAQLFSARAAKRATAPPLPSSRKLVSVNAPPLNSLCGLIEAMP
jgi:hypothetical protein